MAVIRLALIGLGKIARDQHLPTIARDDRFTLAATVDPIAAGIAGVPHFDSLNTLLANGPPVDAVAICTPPQTRTELAATALQRGLHVLLEKPPSTTVGAVEALRILASRWGVTLFSAWHSRFASGVAPARDWLAGRRIVGGSVVWREDVRVWHPGQNWIWEPGGFGVFDPGVNALSILTYILPQPILVTRAHLMFPGNLGAPIAAELIFKDLAGAEIIMDLDFRQTGPQSWDIALETESGTLNLSSGGAELSLPSSTTRRSAELEYPSLYDHFGRLIAAGRSDVDAGPLKLVADAFLIGQRTSVEPFYA